MDWISVGSSIPVPFQVVWIYWKDVEVLLGCRIDDDWIASEDWYSFDDEKCGWARFWLPIESGNLDKPSNP